MQGRRSKPQSQNLAGSKPATDEQISGQPRQPIQFNIREPSHVDRWSADARGPGQCRMLQLADAEKTPDPIRLPRGE